MNILHLLSQNSLTGAEVYAVQLARWQKQHGHQVFQASNGFFTASEAEKIHMQVETTSAAEFSQSAQDLRRLLIEKKIHVVHAHSRAASKLASQACRGLHVGYISTLHGRQHFSLSKRLKNIYGQFLIPVCENIQIQLTDQFHYSNRKIKLIRNGLDQTLYFFRPDGKTLADGSQLSMFECSQTLKIAIIGRLSGPKKLRTEIFIREFTKILEHKKINYTIDLVGVSQNELATLALDPPLTTRLQAVQKPELNSQIYQNYNLICGSGRVAIEALISGVPVIAFGESSYCGLVTSTNYDSSKTSNFGDVGADFSPPRWDAQQALSDINALFQMKPEDLHYLSQKAVEDYSLDARARQIQRVYESAYFEAHYNKWIPILMYHKIPDADLTSQHKIFVNKFEFEKHLQFFQKRGFSTLTFKDLSLFRRGLRPWHEFPSKPLILTFDDGYKDNLDNALPLLKKFNFSAEIFLLADVSVNTNSWDYGPTEQSSLLMTTEERQRLEPSIFTVGSHGFSHARLPQMTTHEKVHELTQSKKHLEHEFKTSVITYAFTYGDSNKDCEVLAEQCGYDYAVNTDRGGLTLEENPYSIFRVNIFPHETIFSLWKKTSSWYRRYYHWKRGH